MTQTRSNHQARMWTLWPTKSYGVFEAVERVGERQLENEIVAIEHAAYQKLQAELDKWISDYPLNIQVLQAKLTAAQAVVEAARDWLYQTSDLEHRLSWQSLEKALAALDGKSGERKPQEFPEKCYRCQGGILGIYEHNGKPICLSCKDKVNA